MNIVNRFTLASGVFLISVPVLADRFDYEVRRQLAAEILQAAGDNYHMTHDPFIGSATNGKDDPVKVKLHAGVSYAITGVCDEDCGDLDIKLYDENLHLIDSDMDDDDHPVVKVSPRWTGNYLVEIIMSNCRNSPCRYGIGIFGI